MLMALRRVVRLIAAISTHYVDAQLHVGPIHKALPDGVGVQFMHARRSYSIPDWSSSDPLAAAGVGEVVASAGDDGRVRLFNYPAVMEGAPAG